MATVATVEKKYAAFLFLAVSFLIVFFIKTPGWIPFSHHGLNTAGNNTLTAGIDPVNNVEVLPPAKSPFKKGGGKAASRKVIFPGFPIDINSAGRHELMMLPGIGEKSADRILEKRDELKGFQSTEDLMEVKGIGPGKYERVRGLIMVGKNAHMAPNPEGVQQKTP